jgi:hypothetical protein
LGGTCSEDAEKAGDDGENELAAGRQCAGWWFENTSEKRWLGSVRSIF